MTDKQLLLIVEDDLGLSEMLSAFFSMQNYEVKTAAWGEDALKICRETTPSLIMLDIRLPDIDGYDVCRQIRMQRKTQDVPILFLTEKRDRVDRLQGLELGVVDYITKPFDIHELRLRVRNALTRAHQQALINPITELAEESVTEARLTSLVLSDDPWSAMVFTIQGVDRLREMYGFLAADEMRRALALIVRNALRDTGRDAERIPEPAKDAKRDTSESAKIDFDPGAPERDYVGHYHPDAFLVITTADRAAAVRERIEARVRYSLQNFYRSKDEDAADQWLQLHTTTLTPQQGPFRSLEHLKEKIDGVPPTNAAVEVGKPTAS